MTSVVRWVEVHRLAVAGREAGIARDVGAGLAGCGWPGHGLRMRPGWPS